MDIRQLNNQPDPRALLTLSVKNENQSLVEEGRSEDDAITIAVC